MDKEQANREDIKPFSTKSIVLITLLAAIFVCACEYYGLAAIQPRQIMAGAVKGLRQIGSAQLAYQAINNWKDYGSFENLQENGGVPKEMSEENFLPNYYLAWRVRTNHYPSVIACCPPDRSFTIVAYPLEPRRLRTFAITEDQMIRVYDPIKSDDPKGVHTWEIAQRWNEKWHLPR
jgi:hypothetical protein